MKSIRELFRIGKGPSSSHTMGPAYAAYEFKQKCGDDVSRIIVTLYGSLAATGKGHLTDIAVKEGLAPFPVEIIWKKETYLAKHPNALKFEAIDSYNKVIYSCIYYSIGGGAVIKEGENGRKKEEKVYPFKSMKEILQSCFEEGIPLWKQVYIYENKIFTEDDSSYSIQNITRMEINSFLKQVWNTMENSLNRGLNTEGVLPGALRLERKAHSFYLKSRRNRTVFQRTGLLSSYALAVAEENAAGGIIVTAPTCGSAGVLPAVLRYLKELMRLSDEDIFHAIATAGLVGNIVKTNASISGAEAGCQAEIGTACAMAAAAAAELMGGTPLQIEYAAEMGLEHHLGLTCDPINGLVQIPCIERNATAATRALDCADYALLSDGRHRISFDEVVQTMLQTGLDLKKQYKETAEGGLAKVHNTKI